MKSRLDSITDLLKLRYDHKQSALREIQNEEMQLREKLTKLAEQERKSQLNLDTDISAIGADVIWKAWTSRTRERLNLDLAQVLARKEVLLSRMRTDFGKLSVAKELTHKAKIARHKEKEDTSLQKSIDAQLFARLNDR